MIPRPPQISDARKSIAAEETLGTSITYYADERDSNRGSPRPVVQPQQTASNERANSRHEQKHIGSSQFQAGEKRSTQRHGDGAGRHQHHKTD
jgi:hypothetical protein